MKDSLKIKCIGFSVTGYGNPCYPVVMEKYFNSAAYPVEISYSSVGGLSIDALPYLLSSMVKEGDVDLVILEIATSWFSYVRTRREESDAYLKLIINYLESIKVKILFLNLYRKDINDNDLVVQSIKTTAQNKYPILDFKAEFRDRLSKAGDDGTTDGVHPTAETITIFSAKVSQYVMDNIDQMQLYTANLEHPEYFKLVDVNASDDRKSEFDNHHGLVLKTTLLRQGEKIDISFDVPTTITGIFFLFGPDTNQVDLAMDEEIINVPMRDEMSYYRRVGYRYLGVRTIRNLSINHSSNLLEIALAREPWEKVDGYQNYIIGFSTGI